MRKPIVCSVLALLVLTAAEDARAASRTRVSYIVSSRGNYVFPATEAEKISNLGLIAGKSYGSSGKAYAIHPYGLEVDYRYEPVEGMPIYLAAVARAVPTAMRLRPGDAEQDGWDGLITGNLSYLSTISHSIRAGFDLGFRVRRWFLESGPMPDSGHMGLVVAVRIDVSQMEFLLESGLMALGGGTPASLGVQRDSSTLRFRAAHHISDDRDGLMPWIEFFHTHRDFYASQLIAGEPALFTDEAALSLGLSFEL